MTGTVPVAPELPGYSHLHSGKVRDVYVGEGGDLLLVASDRISAFDRVLETPIPDKGRLLTAMSAWWFDRLADLVSNHLVPDGDVPAEVAGRALRCRQLDMVPVECVARGYLAGSALAEYHSGGEVCGIRLPAGLLEGSRLPDPVFTPATKATGGAHDENVTHQAVADLVGADTAARLRVLTLQVYRHGAEIARERGIVVADTKLEFGVDRETGALVLADEVFTPDSSRFWPADSWVPGRPQPSFDKQVVRDWLVEEAGWRPDGDEPPPPLPDEVVEHTRSRYVEAYERLTGHRWR